MDDGFQHRKFHRDLDIVTLPDTILDEELMPVGRQADFTDAFMENMDGTWFQHAINLPIHLQQMLNQ